MKIFTMTCGAEVMLDDEDYDRLPKTGWYLSQKKRSDSNQDRKTVYAVHDDYGRMHRWILGITDPKILVDHIDHNGLNNQKSNLRIVSSGINKKNQTIICNNKFHFNGISYENGKYNRIRVHWSEGEPEYKEGFGWKAKAKVKSFSLNKYNMDYNLALKDAILFRIQKMKENNYLLDERSTTIEKTLLETEYPNMEEILDIKFSEVFE